MFRSQVTSILVLLKGAPRRDQMEERCKPTHQPSKGRSRDWYFFRRSLYPLFAEGAPFSGANRSFSIACGAIFGRRRLRSACRTADLPSSRPPDRVLGSRDLLPRSPGRALRHSHISKAGRYPSPALLGKVARSAGWGVVRCLNFGSDCTTVTLSLHRAIPAFRTPSGPITRRKTGVFRRPMGPPSPLRGEGGARRLEIEENRLV